MTEASAGLRKALARNAGVSKLSNDELLAAMSDEQKAAIAAALAPVANAAAETPAPTAAAGDDEDEDDTPMGDKKKSKDKEKEYMSESEAAAKGATDRALAVMSSEHFAGNQAAATKLLAKEQLSADEIIGLLADLNPPAANAADPEDAARAEMQAALKAAGKSEVEANNGGTTAASASSNIWEKTYAKLGIIKPAA